MNKNIERQLRVLVLHAKGSSREGISLITEYNITSISRIVSQYMDKGLSFFIENNYKGNNRNLSYEEESIILSPYLDIAKADQLVDINEIKLAYEGALGRPLKSRAHIYRVLARHGWCLKGTGPVVPSQLVREYRYAYGVVDPLRGDSFFLVLPAANKECMKIFINELSDEYPDDVILMVYDKASWHTSASLEVLHNIRMLFLPPTTPEMNPIEQIWKELRKSFKNEVFKTLECEAILSLSKNTIKKDCRIIDFRSSNGILALNMKNYQNHNILIYRDIKFESLLAFCYSTARMPSLHPLCDSL